MLSFGPKTKQMVAVERQGGTRQATPAHRVKIKETRMRRLKSPSLQPLCGQELLVSFVLEPTVQLLPFLRPPTRPLLRASHRRRGGC